MPEQNFIDVCRETDWELFRQQRDTLQEIIRSESPVAKTMMLAQKTHIEGMLNLLDDIQDAALAAGFDAKAPKKLPQRTVHIYATVVIKVTGIPSEDQHDAMKQAVKFVHLAGLLDHKFANDLSRRQDLHFEAPETMQVCSFASAEEITGFLVDEPNDPEFQLSQDYTGNMKKIKHTRSK